MSRLSKSSCLDWQIDKSYHTVHEQVSFTSTLGTPEFSIFPDNTVQAGAARHQTSDPPITQRPDLPSEPQPLGLFHVVVRCRHHQLLTCRLTLTCILKMRTAHSKPPTGSGTRVGPCGPGPELNCEEGDLVG